MIEHEEHLGAKWEDGLYGLKTAIMGYSHHYDRSEPDTDDFTLRTIDEVVNGAAYPFFSRIESYFNADNRQQFWERVCFFNFLPDAIGTSDDRYGSGSPDQVERGKHRFRRIIDAHKPDRLLVFTRRGWQQLPPFDGSMRKDGVKLPEAPTVEVGSYKLSDGSDMLTFGLPHPQYSSTDVQRAAVQKILGIRSLNALRDAVIT